jgi:hypothetical protein
MNTATARAFGGHASRCVGEVATRLILGWTLCRDDGECHLLVIDVLDDVQGGSRG